MIDNYLVELESAVSLSNKARVKELLELVEGLDDLSQIAATNFYSNFVNDPELVMLFLQKNGSITAEYSD